MDYKQFLIPVTESSITETNNFEIKLKLLEQIGEACFNKLKANPKYKELPLSGKIVVNQNSVSIKLMKDPSIFNSNKLAMKFYNELEESLLSATYKNNRKLKIDGYWCVVISNPDKPNSFRMTWQK